MEEQRIVNMAIEHIHPHPMNPRQHLGDLTELTESIKKRGILQNLTIVPQEGKPGEYLTVIGNRRREACILAGKKEVPCVIKEMSEKEQIATMLEENLQRSDLTVIEQAEGFQMMLDLGETEESIAKRTGFSRKTIQHRLNIAKLDQDELRGKEQDESFQLTLTDLYALEKVDDIETRNKILKEAHNSKELIWRAQSAVTQAERLKKASQIVEILSKLGLEAAPKTASHEIYTNKWEVIMEINLDEDVPAEIVIEDTADVFYLEQNRTVMIIKKRAQVENEDTAEIIRLEEIKSNKMKIKARLKEMDAERKEFVLNIVSGTHHLKNENAVREKIWKAILETGGYVSSSNLRKFFTGKMDYECTPEEKEAAQKQVEKTIFTQSMLIALHNSMIGVSEIYDYDGHYRKEIGNPLLNAYKVLKTYGWTFADTEDEQILDGTSQLYEKEPETIAEHLTEQEVA